jgi:ribose-phosphate pyrophosphokinase
MMLADHFADLDDDRVVAAPDAGRVNRTRSSRPGSVVSCHPGIIEDPQQQIAEISHVIGGVRGKTPSSWTISLTQPARCG